LGEDDFGHEHQLVDGGIRSDVGGLQRAGEHIANETAPHSHVDLATVLASHLHDDKCGWIGMRYEDLHQVRYRGG
jgi:hypothetical protein